MKSIIAEALHHALSVLSDESHAAVVFMLDDRYDVKLHGLTPINMDDIRKGLEDLFGQSAGILITRMDEYLLQHSAPVLEIKVSPIQRSRDGSLAC